MKSQTVAVQIDFLPEELRRRYQAHRQARGRCAVVLLLVTAMGLVQLGVEGEVARLRRIVDSMEHAAQAGRKLEQQLERLQTALQGVEVQARQLLARRNIVPRWAILIALAECRPEGLWWEEIHIREEDRFADSAPGGTTIAGVARTASQGPGTPPSEAALHRQTVVHCVGRATELRLLSDYVRRLQALPAVRQVEILGLQSEKDGGHLLRFELRLRWQPACTPESAPTSPPVPEAYVRAEVQGYPSKAPVGPEYGG